MDEGPRWLDAREARAWRAYTRMRVQLTARLSRELVSRSGLSDADYSVLVSLSEAPDGRVRAFALGNALQWEKSRLSHHLTRMSRRGLVVREECESDARGSFVAITEAGRTAIESAAPAHVDDVRRHLISVLTPEQLDALADIAETVNAGLEADPDPQCGPGDTDLVGDPDPIRTT